MRRAVAVVTALLLVHAAALRSGVLCEVLTPAAPVHLQGHDMNHSPPPSVPPSSHHDHGTPAHCALMASCGMMTVGSLAPRMSSAAGPLVSVPVARQFAPRSVHAAPEPPPPKA